ncbi:MAG: hypothetical protein WDW36_010349 [Sanguina aurantia]
MPTATITKALEISPRRRLTVSVRAERVNATEQWEYQANSRRKEPEEEPVLQQEQQQFQHPPLEVVDYAPDYVNTACLIGSVLGPIEAILDSNNQLAQGMLRLSVQNKRAQVPDMYEVLFPAALLPTIQQEVRPNDSVYVQGPISVHRGQSSPEQPGQTMMGVVSALSVYLIKGSRPTHIMAEVDTPENYGMPLASADISSAVSASSGRSNEPAWQLLVNAPEQYYDNRINKSNPKAPDFKHKTSGEALWLSDMPAWAAQRVQAIPLPKSKDDAWGAVLDAPDQYYDNRETKLNPRGPDFKHKTNGEALWVKDAPQWVLEKLQGMPASQSTQRGVGKDALWEAVFATPGEYFDNRESKLNPKAPDFKHKVSGEALWVIDASQWVLDRLAAMPPAPQSTIKRGSGQDAEWEAVFANPDQYFDNRLTKLNPKGPDFKHKTSGEVLWVNGAPEWVIDRLATLVPQAGKQQGGKDAVWEAVLNTPDLYYDNRKDKRNPKAPDFKHKTTGEALWLNDAPSWALERLQ